MPMIGARPKCLYKIMRVNHLGKSDAMNCLLKVDGWFAFVPYSRTTGFSALTNQNITKSQLEFEWFRILETHFKKV